MAGSNSKATSSSRGTKSKPSKPVTLKVPSAQLMKWVDQKDAVKPSAPPSKGGSTSSTPPVTSKNSPTEIKAEASGANTPEVQSGKDMKKNGNGAKTGAKRGAAALEEGKARAKPGPKRRKLYVTSSFAVLELIETRDGPIDENNRPWTTPAAPVGHKLGPKANQGAINACLRALDLTGKPSRKWTRKPFMVKSFTGTVWELPTWATPTRQEEKGDSTPTSNSENPPAPSSNVGSDAPVEAGIAASSPPVVSTPA